MKTSKKQLIIPGIIIILIALFWALSAQSPTTENVGEVFVDDVMSSESDSQTEVSEEETQNTIDQNIPTETQAVAQTGLPTQWPGLQGENITNWNYTGSYTGNPELEAKAQTEIERLKVLDDGTSEYKKLIAIANQYHYLGDGANAYLYYQEAIKNDPKNNGLAWFNMGNLMQRLGAYKSARFAYETAVEIQDFAQYKNALNSLLKNQF